MLQRPHSDIIILQFLRSPLRLRRNNTKRRKKTKKDEKGLRDIWVAALFEIILALFYLQLEILIVEDVCSTESCESCKRNKTQHFHPATFYAFFLIKSKS